MKNFIRKNRLIKSFIHSIILYALFACIAVSSAYSQTQRSNLPTIYITTNNYLPVTSKTTYLPARIVIVSSDLSENLDVVTEIRGRGNSTWEMTKKPYRIKLDKKYNILNLSAKAKSWTLLANFADKTLMRNALAFKISEVIGLEFTPSVRFVDLVLNGNFLGNYMLSDQVQVHEHRVNVDELTETDTDPDIITGGYLLEVDGFAHREPESYLMNTTRNVPISFKSPDVLNKQQRTYITSFVQDFENRLFSANFKDPELGYRAVVDSATLINWYIGSELTGNPDAFWSTYIYKKRGIDKLFFGPMWDYDIAFNNDNRLGDATQKLMREHGHGSPGDGCKSWAQRMYQDEWFVKAVNERWEDLLTNGLSNKLLTYITETETLLNQSQKLNFDLWRNLNNRVYLEQFLFNTYGEGVNYLKTYISNRIKFLTESFAAAMPFEPSEEFLPEYAYYSIKSKKSNNIIDVAGESVDLNAAIVTWESVVDSDSRLWEFVSAGNDLYRIVNKQSGLVITGNGQNQQLTQTAQAESNAQKWKIVPVNFGNYYCIVNEATGLSMNNSGGGLTNGTPVIEYTSGLVLNSEGYYTVESENRQWRIKKMEMKENMVSTPDVVSVKSFFVYPNPVIDRINIQTNIKESGNITITIHDLLGQEMYREIYPPQNQGLKTFEIIVNNMNSGVYILTLSSNNGMSFTQKITVK